MDLRPTVFQFENMLKAYTGVVGGLHDPVILAKRRDQERQFREAIEARIRWAGLEDVPFRFVSAAENMHACKPHPEYFLEVLERIGRKSAECVMVGDDPVKDMPAARVGITTFFVPLPGERRRPAAVARAGTLEDLARWLEELGPAA